LWLARLGFGTTIAAQAQMLPNTVGKIFTRARSGKVGAPFKAGELTGKHCVHIELKIGTKENLVLGRKNGVQKYHITFN